MSKRKTPSRYIPKAVKEAVKIRDGNNCRICGRNSEYMEFDHITPFSKGAPSTVGNIQLLCRKCNIAKRNTTDSCSKCGKWIAHDATFCHHCGNVQRQINYAKKRKSISRKLLLVFAVWMIFVGLSGLLSKLL